MSINDERRPARRAGGASLLRWFAGLGPLQSWLLVMAVLIGLNLLGQRSLALLVAVCWTGYALYTWLAPGLRRRLDRFWRR